MRGYGEGGKREKKKEGEGGEGKGPDWAKELSIHLSIFLEFNVTWDVNLINRNFGAHTQKIKIECYLIWHKGETKYVNL